jgi:hypothetical protein
MISARMLESNLDKFLKSLAEDVILSDVIFKMHIVSSILRPPEAQDESWGYHPSIRRAIGGEVAYRFPNNDLALIRADNDCFGMQATRLLHSSVCR